MTDPLREAAEMVSADARDETVEGRAHCHISLEAIRTLRAALAADRLPERARAAVELCEAQDANDEAYERWDGLINEDPSKTDWGKVEPAGAVLDATQEKLRAAREGWAAVGGRRVVVVDG